MHDRGLMRAVCALAIAFAFVGSPSRDARASPAEAPDAPASVTIAYQPGIGYANLIVMKEQRTLETQFPGTSFSWKVLSNGDVIRDGIIANQIQIGAGGVGPFLIGWDRGVGYRLIGALNEMDLWLASRDPAVRTLKDIKPNMQIGLPSPDSIQAIALRKGAAQQLGNPRALDANLLAISHPEGLAALQHGQLALHMSAPPFEFQEQQDGAHIVFRSVEAFGVTTFNSVFATDAFYAAHPHFVDAFSKDLQAATAFIRRDRKGAAQLLAQDAGNKVPAATFADWLDRKQVNYSTTPRGFMAYAKFMQSIGLLSKIPASMKDIELPNLGNVGS